MSRTSNCIRMLQLLNTGRTIKISELADILETTPRNIIEYRKELECAGYYIDAIPGKYGGYKLNRNVLFPSLNLTLEDKNALIDVFNYSMSKKDFINKNGFLETMSKLFSSLLITNVKEYKIQNEEKIPSLINESLIQRNYFLIQKAIKEKKVIAIEYRWLKKPISIEYVHPYQLFLYDNEWRFFCWNENYNEDEDPIFYLKLSRIQSIKFTSKTFKVYKYFKFEDYVKKNVFTTHGEMFQLKLKAKGIRGKLFKEKQYGYNQVCKDLENGDVEVTCEMQKNPSTYNTLLGFGDLVEVLEPEWLRIKLKELALTIIKKY